MMIKFLAVGTGDPAAAAAYVLSDVDHLNFKRAGVKVLRGDPLVFAALAKSSRHKFGYSSAVIAWHLNDAPTDADIEEVVEEFEVHAFAGLKKDQYHMTVVQHDDDDGSKHLHILVPRFELTSGKSLNIAPPGHQKYFDALRDYFNIKKNWARPDVYTPKNIEIQPHVYYQHEAALRVGMKGKSKKDRLQLINHFVETRILAGQITNRATLIDALSEIGEVSRSKKNFISLTTEHYTDRLAGEFYHEQFSIATYIENRSRKQNAARTSADVNAVSTAEFDRVREYRDELEGLRNKRYDYNRKYYAIKQPIDREFEIKCAPELSISSTTIRATAGNRPTRRTTAGSEAMYLYTSSEFSVSANPAIGTEYYNSKRFIEKSKSCEYFARKIGFETGNYFGEYSQLQTTEFRVNSATTVTQKNSNFLNSFNSHIIHNLRINFLKGDQHATNDRTRQIDARKNSGATFRDTNAETAAQSATAYRAKIERYAKITAGLSRKTEEVERRIKHRVEQQKQFNSVLSTDTIAGQISARLERFNTRIKTSFSSAIAKLFGFFRNDRSNTQGGSERNRSILIESTTHRLDRLFRVNELRRELYQRIAGEIKTSRFNYDRVRRLCCNYQEITESAELCKKPKNTLHEILWLLKQNTPWISTYKSERYAESVDKLFNDLYDATKEFNTREQAYVDEMTIRRYRDSVGWGIDAIRSELSACRPDALDLMLDYINTIKRYSELIELRQQQFFNKQDYKLLDHDTEYVLETFEENIQQRKEELIQKDTLEASDQTLISVDSDMSQERQLKSTPNSKQEVDQSWDLDF